MGKSLPFIFKFNEFATKAEEGEQFSCVCLGVSRLTTDGKSEEGTRATHGANPARTLRWVMYAMYECAASSKSI